MIPCCAVSRSCSCFMVLFLRSVVVRSVGSLVFVPVVWRRFWGYFPFLSTSASFVALCLDRFGLMTRTLHRVTQSL